MLFFRSIAELLRAADGGAIGPQDTVFVPAGVLREAGEAEAAEQAVLRAGARFQAMLGLQRVAVVSLAELNEGLVPPGRREA